MKKDNVDPVKVEQYANQKITALVKDIESEVYDPGSPKFSQTAKVSPQDQQVIDRIQETFPTKKAQESVQRPKIESALSQAEILNSLEQSGLIESEKPKTGKPAATPNLFQRLINYFVGKPAPVAEAVPLMAKQSSSTDFIDERSVSSSRPPSTIESQPDKNMDKLAKLFGPEERAAPKSPKADIGVAGPAPLILTRGSTVPERPLQEGPQATPQSPKATPERSSSVTPLEVVTSANNGPAKPPRATRPRS